MSLSTYWLLAGLFLLASAVSLIVLSLRLQRARSVEQNLARTMAQVTRREAMFQQSQAIWRQTKYLRFASITDIQLLLRKAGYLTNREQTSCLLKVMLAWATMQGMAVMAIIERQVASEQAMGLLVLSTAGGAYLALQWLKKKVVSRAKMIDEELIMGLQMMKTLWDVGLSLESMLRAYTAELKEMTPEMNKELLLALSKIEAGQDRAWVFVEVARVNESLGMQDLLNMFAQVSDSGGSMSDSLAQLTLLLRDRRRTQLQEKVSKLSGRMSVVMMLFLFPPLFVVLAGPGMMALGRALGN
ncbi:type II secretion system F family protein [Photobacterium atrarenae]|uniref:Type II secretion system F family protein n=1 Tax=Photobacterium atrarenae TaxID=865757 RepID=A0ABY5GHG7_9GAMM|nr:type II secretion system F family protein [Photobacterium atrarenae]UTV28606.1 type II secretion system F family protein [Photobacterium atrarenae]